MRRFRLIVFSAVSVLAFAPQAHGDPATCDYAQGCLTHNDYYFLKSLSSVGITGTPMALLNEAGVVCGYIKSGYKTPEVMASDLQKAQQYFPTQPTYFSQDQANAFVNASLAHCS